CSCNVGCPCALGEKKADRGRCSGALVFDVKRGSIDGTDVSGTKVAFVGDWPSGFLAGQGVARLYFDKSMSEQKMARLEQVFAAKLEGLFAVIPTLFNHYLPSKEEAIQISHQNDETARAVGSVANLPVKPLRGPTGQVARLLNGAAAFR